LNFRRIKPMNSQRFEYVAARTPDIFSHDLGVVAALVRKFSADEDWDAVVDIGGNPLPFSDAEVAVLKIVCGDCLVPRGAL
jgi:hypothetical protein